MTPSNFLRAMLPLRSNSSWLFSATAVTVTNLRPAICNSVSRRCAFSTSTTRSDQVQTPENGNPSSPAAAASTIASTIATTTTPPLSTPPISLRSLRQYPYALKVGTVTSVGKMDKTVRVAYRHNTWDRHIRKIYPKVTTYLVSDPRNSLREGDVIEFSSGAPKSRHVRHVVERIITPFGVGIEERPAIMSRQEREAERAKKMTAKVQRRVQRLPENGGESAPPVKDHVGKVRGLILKRITKAKKMEQRHIQAQ